jgi:hypothetical protein
VAAATLRLFEKYGLNVPKVEWDRALRGASEFEEKLFCTDDIKEAQVEPTPRDLPSSEVLVPTASTDVLLVYDKDALLKLPQYHFAQLQTKTSAVDRKLKASRGAKPAELRRTLSHYFYLPADTDLPPEFKLYYNAELKVALAVYSPTNNYWFLQP